MAIIYGFPVILLQKPDTSEQWLLNSTITDKNSTQTSQWTFQENNDFISNNEEFVKFSLILD